MKKKLILLLIVFGFMFMASCNTSRPSAYLSSIEENLRKETFVVEFNTNGGNDIEDVKVKGGRTVDVPETPTKEHAEFNGWYLDKELTKQYDFSVEVWSNLTLYARWIPYHRVTFVTIGGTDVEAQYVKDGYNAEFETTTKEGHEFLGWYTDSGYTHQFDFGTAIKEDVYLYARWS